MKSILSKNKGALGTTTATYCLFFMLVIMLVCLQLFSYKREAARLEDALVSANLAAEVVDLRQFAADQTLYLDPDRSFQLFQSYLQDNYVGNVQVEEFVIYNVQSDGSVEEICIAGGGVNASYPSGTLVYAPDGSPVENSGVYARISAPYEGYFGIRTRVIRSEHTDLESVWEGVM